MKKENPIKVFFCEFCEIYNNNFLNKTRTVTASSLLLLVLLFKVRRVLFDVFFLQSNKLKRIKPIKFGPFRVCVCPSGGFFFTRGTDSERFRFWKINLPGLHLSWKSNAEALWLTRYVKKHIFFFGF